MAWNKHAFTLIEILIVVLLFAVVVSTVVAAFAGGISVWESASRFESGLIDGVLCLEELERDLRNAVEFQSQGFEVSERTLSFAAIVDGQGSDAGEIWRIQYEYDRDERTLSRSGSPFTARRRERDDRSVIGAGFSDMRFRVTGGFDDEGDSRRLPPGIRIELVIGEGRESKTISRTVYLPCSAGLDSRQCGLRI